ncbi:hypothetical protein CFOL_v3_20361 [Cephalotus follicularis]|uniref:Uncharacterized protein n=1 Tax=Cephalotus follicularis TaxID=3775 RepID=A0A1Q3C9W4_CEPFO|nr:hypothetical protein CFOL_v3_20361 [Cephalotus follicularis]
MEDHHHPLQKIAISGPTLASLIQRVSTSPGDVDGLLFGHVTQMTHSSLSDDTTAPSSSSTTDFPSNLIATITTFLCFNSTLSFYTPLGDLHPHHPQPHPHHPLLGWFSARRKTPLRPSMREFSVTNSLSSNITFPITDSRQPSANFAPSLFLLLTTPLHDHIIHTHEYRAYQFSPFSRRFDPKSIEVVNIGPGFRGHYGNFTPKAALPWMSCELRCPSAMNEDSKEGEGGENLLYLKQALKDQEVMDLSAEGFDVRNLSRLMGPEAASYTAGLEDFYEKMLAKIDSLARLVESSEAKILGQVDHNRQLRNIVSKPIGGDKNPACS